jgi:hypothetical protein
MRLGTAKDGKGIGKLMALEDPDLEPLWASLVID